MKIILSYISGQDNRDDPFITMLPTGLCYLHASLLSAGFDSLLANYSAWSESDIKAHLVSRKPSVFGISQWTHNRHASMKLARLVRKTLPGCTIIMGGSHASFCYAQQLGVDSPVDIIVRGEGETTLLELAGRIDRGESYDDLCGIAFCRGKEQVLNPPAPLQACLDLFPFSVIGLEKSVGIDLEMQSEFIVTARGCPSACNFCSSPGFWNKKLRFRSPANIVDEIRHIQEHYGLIYFSLRDDTFTADRTRAIEFCRLLLESRLHIIWNCQSRVTALDEELLVWMKRAGCECVQLGIESGSPRILDYLGKNITPEQVVRAADMVKTVGINLSVYLISDIPMESEADVALTVALIKRIQPDDGYVSPLAYFPGTRLFNDAVSSGTVGADIFEKSRETAVYALGRTGRNSGRILDALTRHGASGGKDFARQKQLLGYCHATNVISGEWYLQNGDPQAAEREFREITAKEPGNPWGWFLLAEMQEEAGLVRQARKSYQRVLAIVPRHSPSLRAVERL